VVSWVPQIVVPPLVALAFLRSLPRRWVLLLAPVTYLADIDYLFPNEHRVYTHTLLIPALLLGAVALLWRRAAKAGEDAGFWAFARRPGWPVALLLAAYYLAAHDVMDVFTGGVALLWPLWPTNYYVDYSITIDLVHRTVTPQVETGATPQPAPLDESYPWLSPEHSAILAFLFAVGLVAFGAWLGRRWARPREPQGASTDRPQGLSTDRPQGPSTDRPQGPSTNDKTPPEVGGP
jgi:membrane-bound metal-dependent hydrolase YbcI (DUF457 family)